MNTQSNPYIGPRTFQRSEGHLFFGREREARDLISLVASERLVVFYAQSGAGKSSIVNTRLIPNLEEKGYEVLPVGRVGGDSGEGVDVHNIYVYNLLRSLEQHDVDPSQFARLTLAQFLCQLNYDDKGFFFDPSLPDSVPGGEEETVIRRALIIDQFEELFSTHPEAWEKREGFFLQVAQAMQEDPHLWMVLVMREDYIAALDPYAHLVSNGLRVRYYMQRLGREAALKAVKSPVEGIRPYAEGVAEKLIDDLCSIKVQQPDGTLDVQPGQYVEPVQMQVVCYGLWDNLSPDGTQITEKDLQDVGDVNQSLGKYYDKRVGEVAKAKNVRERMIREWFEKKLITAGGIRNMVLQEREPKPGELSDDVIQSLQSDLVRGEKRGGATWYELTHDRLVEPILERNKIWFSENLSPLQRQAALWKDQDQNESWLLRDQALVEVEEWTGDHQDELTDTEKEFLAACQKLQAQIDERHAAERNRLEMAQKLADEQTRAAKRARVFNVVSGILIVIAVIATVFSVRAARIADEEKVKAQAAEVDANTAKSNAEEEKNKARSSELSFLALEKADSQFDLAILLGLQADAVYPGNPRAQQTLLNILQKSSRYLGTVEMPEIIQQFQYHPGGDTFALLDKNGITFWDANTRKQQGNVPLNGHYGAVGALALSPDGKYLASGGGEGSDGSIVIWDAANRVPLTSEPVKAHNGFIKALTFSPDGKILASGSWNDTAVKLWSMADPAAPVPVSNVLQMNSGVICLAFSPDGKTLAAGDGSGGITLWNVETGEALGEPLYGHFGSVYGLAFNPQGTILASGSYDDTVILWDVSDLEHPTPIGEPLIGANPVDIETIAMSPDGKIVASGDDFGNIILWDVQTGEALTEQPLNGYGPEESPSWVVSLAFSPDGKTLAAGYYTDGRVDIWDVQQQTKIGRSIDAHSNSVWGVVFEPDGKTLITASQDTSIQYWDLSRPTRPERIGEPLLGHRGTVSNFEFSRDGSLLATYGTDGTVLFDYETQTRLGYGELVGTSPDNDFVVYQLADLATGESIIHIREVSSGVEKNIPGINPTFSPDGKLLVYETILDDTTTVNFWDLAAGNSVAGPAEISGAYIGSTPDGQTLIYDGLNERGEGAFLFWDVVNGRVIKTIPFAEDPSAPAPVVSPDGRFLAFVSTFDEGSTRVISLLDTSTTEAQPDFTFEPTADTITNIFFSQNGNILFYASQDADGIESFHVLNSSTGHELTNDTNGQLNGSSESGPFIAYGIYDNQTGETTTELINTVSADTVFSDSGTFLNLVKDGQLLVYSDENGIHLFDPTRSQAIGDPIQGIYMGISPNAEILVSSSDTKNVFFWDLTRTWTLGKPVTDETDFISDAAISADGNSSAWISEKGIVVTKDGTFFGPFVDHLSGFPGSFAAFSPDGSMVAIGNFTTNITALWDLKTQRLLSDEFSGFYPSFSPDGKWLAIGNNNATTGIWDMSTQELVKDQLPGYFPSFSPAGGMLAIGDVQLGNTLIWDVNTWQQMSGSFSGIVPAFSPDGRLLAIGTGNTIMIWDIATGQQVAEVAAGTFPAFSPDGKWLAVGDYSSDTITLWDAATLEQVGDDFAGSSPAFSADGSVLAAGSEPRVTTALWKIDSTGKKLEAIQRPAPGTSIVLSTDGKILASHDESDGIILRDLVSGSLTPLSTGTEYDGQVSNIMNFYSNNTGFVALGHPVGAGPDGTLLRWNMETGQIDIGEIPKFNQQVAAFSPDGNYLAYSEDGKVLKVWDVSKNTSHGGVIGSINLELDPESPKTVAFSPDGKVLAYSNGNKVSLYEFPSLKQIRSEIRVDSPVYGLSILMEGTDVKYLLTLYDNGGTQIWDWNTETKIGDLMPGNLQFVGSNIERQLGYYIDPSGKLIQFQWNLEHKAWQDLLCPLVKRNFKQAEWELYFPSETYPTDNLACPQYPGQQEITATETAPVATRVPAPTQAANNAATEAPVSTEPVADVEALMQDAKILVFEDTAREGLLIEPVLKDTGFESNTTFVGGALGAFQEQMTSDTQWDLIIVSAEADSAISGEYWDLIKRQLDNGSSVIIETRALDHQSQGRVRSLLGACGVEVQSNLELAVPIFWYEPDSPILIQPNLVDELSTPKRYWDNDAGDLLKVTGKGDATILAGINSEMVDQGVLVSCYDGRLLLQTFSSHDYPVGQVAALWQNYIYNLLYDRFAR